MGSEFLQFLFSGITVGAIYALAALGFTIIFNASGIINFAQGEFVMLGGMLTYGAMLAGIPLPLAIVIAIVLTTVIGFALERFAIQPAGNAQVISLIVITIGASIFLQGVIQVVLGRDQHILPAFSGDKPFVIGGATLLPQTLWVVGITSITVIGLWFFFNRTRMGKAMLATAYNPTAAKLVGINTRKVLFASFGVAGFLGALAGILVAPITLTSFDAGTMFGLKGFVAATLGGLASGPGAIIGGLLLGLAEAMTAGYISSAYKDAVAFIAIIVVLIFRPSGITGRKISESV
jgi:branched-chain amino acid transport system permease protein